MASRSGLRLVLAVACVAVCSTVFVAGFETFASRLARAARGEFDAALRLDVECQTTAGRRSATLHGAGAGTWNDRTAFSLPTDRIRAIVDILHRSGFASMPERFGGRDERAGPDRPKGGPIVTCRIKTKLDDGEQDKEVVQLDTGYQSAAFRRLADDIIQVIEPAASTGVTPSSLTDSLRLVADGSLPPAMLEVVTTYGEGRPAAAQATRCMLSLTGGLLELRVRAAQTLSDVVRVRLDPEAIRHLASVFVEHALATLPANLTSAGYADLNVRVLGWRKSVQARQFAGGTPDAGGVDQQRFQRIVDALRELQQRHSTRSTPVAGCGAPTR